jgi:hypothetical protein
MGRALGAAGLKIKPGYWYPDSSERVAFLLGVEVDAPPNEASFADAVQKALSSTKVGVREQRYPVPTLTEVTIHIGVKPFPLLPK